MCKAPRGPPNAPTLPFQVRRAGDVLHAGPRGAAERPPAPWCWRQGVYRQPRDPLRPQRYQSADLVQHCEWGRRQGCPLPGVVLRGLLQDWALVLSRQPRESPGL